jgi:hypothetical protein
MSTLLRRFCTRIDDFHERRPVIAILIAIAVAIACEIAIGSISGEVMPPVITHIGGFSA